mmetsp:Transcript_55131/g.87513  ORF Transcript_55131/g.87513 Transcript_55131/m.87513 type:complete len:210 (+) Transcript_55131:429-1058(+)
METTAFSPIAVTRSPTIRPNSRLEGAMAKDAVVRKFVASLTRRKNCEAGPLKLIPIGYWSTEVLARSRILRGRFDAKCASVLLFQTWASAAVGLAVSSPIRERKRKLSYCQRRKNNRCPRCSQKTSSCTNTRHSGVPLAFSMTGRIASMPTTTRTLVGSFPLATARSPALTGLRRTQVWTTSSVVRRAFGAPTRMARKSSCTTPDISGL